MENKEYIFNQRTLKVSYTSLDFSKEVYAFLINDGDLIKNIDFKDNVMYLSISTENRLNDYTPYYAKALDKRFADFGGNGSSYLKFLNEELIPTILNDYPLKKDNIIYGGISLGGLHAIYSSFLKNEFKTIFGIVSSLWYTNFIDFIKNNELYHKDTSFFLLNGKKEGSNHINLPLYNAYLKAKEACDLLKEKAEYLEFISDEYAHHDHIDLRFNQLQMRILEKLQSIK